nr:hypothetical protein [Tanacetum cinerariifolium]
LQDEAQAKNEEFLNNLDENIQNIIKEQVKEQVKVQVSKILAKIENTVNEQLEAKVLNRSSNSSKTSYAIATDLSEMELKKILIEKMKSNKSIHRYDEQRNLYKALVDAYKCDKIILDTYGDTVTLKRRRDDADKDEEPSNTTSESAPAEEPTQKTQDLEEHQEFETGAADDQPIIEASQESARDVYSKSRIIDVTKLQIVKWHSYKHLDWITVHRDDDKLYKFKKGDFKRLRIQDIEDMLLLLVQGKLKNLTVKERFAFNVSLRIDGTPNDVRTALDDHLKGIWINYLPHAIWRRSDMERAATMIQAIDKQLKTRRIMRSLEKFIGGRLYEGDFRMLQQTI